MPVAGNGPVISQVRPKRLRRAGVRRQSCRHRACVTRTRHRACIQSYWPPAGASACAVIRPSRHYAGLFSTLAVRAASGPAVLGHRERDVLFRPASSSAPVAPRLAAVGSPRTSTSGAGARRDLDTLDTVEPAARCMSSAPSIKYAGVAIALGRSRRRLELDC